MDPKMDSGMILDSDLNKKPFELRARLKPEQVLWIMDRLFICEMTWHTGHSLSQTLFTCMYLHYVPELTPELFLNTDDTSNDSLDQTSNDSLDQTSNDSLDQNAEAPIEFVILVLKAYVMGTVKCCQLVLDEMAKGNVYEEEDFATNKYGISIYEDFPESQAIKLLDDAETWLEQYGGPWIRLHGDEKSESIIHAIVSRLSLRKSFLLILMHMSQPRCLQYTQAQSQISIAMKLLNGSQSEISVNNTQDLGVEVEGAFDPLINRKLISQTPPRPIRLLSLQESIDEMLNMFKSLNSICEIIDYKSATSLTRFLTYHAAQQPTPCAFSRSLLQSTVCTENRILGKISIYQLVKDSVTELTNPPYIYFASKNEMDVLSNGARIDEAKYNVSKLIHTFVDSTMKPLTDYYRILCHNRSRQRRNMCKVLADWDLLQEESEHIDIELQSITKEEPLKTDEGQSYSFHLSSWVYHHKLMLMEEILFLGFELELYGNHEFVMIYWYLDYLLGVHYQHLERIHIHATDDRKFKKQKNFQSAPSSLSTVSLIISYQTFVMARQDICRGIHRIITALQKTGHFKPPQLEFDDESTRFWHRFKVYRTLGSPTMLTFQELKEMTQLDNISTLDLFNVSLRNFQSARTSIENLLSMKPSDTRMENCHAEFTKDLRAMLRVCIANIVNLLKIIDEFKSISEPNKNQDNDGESNKKGRKQQKQRQQKNRQQSLTISAAASTSSQSQSIAINKVVNFDFKYHPWFPVVTLK
ncbi:Mak10 subunit, NatC N-terminal acetyltransferase-domain-containing protein [Gigaspora rosea]|uniref:Mak10 subunit, NatC N-terminal acetyltransferase-domain-containing protein n=1 Tax=Gigaspora rosea TaxID=44941 RepID=A0A397US88_9GLOM|nr:Mak10 subunit, NatC N-terminal acetyltransferase-domain-containing protein [Gigaspora rosea]